MTARFTLQIATQQPDIPEEPLIKEWVEAALEEPYQQSEITIRIVDENESAHLNRTFRDKNYATNVLSFAFSAPDDYDNILGDIVVCAPIVAMEAEQQNKPLQDHWAHLIIHGVLHLQGYDHLIDTDAEEMEAREIELLSAFNVPNPYIAREGDKSQNE